MYRKVSYKELAHAVIGAGKSQVCRVGWQAGDPGKALAQFRTEGSLLENSLLLRDAGVFVVIRLSAG